MFFQKVIKQQDNKTYSSLPSFLFIFFLKKLFYFLWFSKIWNNCCPVVIEAQPDVFTDLGGDKKNGVKEGVVVKPKEVRE